MLYLLNLLILLFAIEDLIGRKNTRRLEKVWITNGLGIFSAWTTLFASSTRWITNLLVTLSILASMLFLIISSMYAVMTAIGDDHTFLARTGYLAYGLPGGILWGVLGLWGFKYIDSVVQTGYGNRTPIELKWLKSSIKISNYFITETDETKLPGGEVFTILVIVSLIFGMSTLSLLLLTSLFVRGIILILSAIGWIVAFLPGHVLNYLKEKTGADSIINVGKYVLLVIATVITWIDAA